MGWQQQIRYMRRLVLPESASLERFRVNDQCFIRKEHKCKKNFGASKSCFIACPTSDDIEPILALMSEKLAKVGIEAVIAVKERAYGQDIFCTKICGKIIESMFCIVILDDAVIDKQNIPNPNVYYEYGLMTALGKHIIPLQKENLKLAFNIQSYDTIKYNSANIATELDRAIKDAIKICESKNEPSSGIALPDKAIMRSMELAGFEIQNDDWFLSTVIDDTDFRGFVPINDHFCVYLGKIDAHNEIQKYLDDIKVVIYRTEKKFRELEEKLKGLEKQKANFTKRIEQSKSVEHGHISDRFELTHRMQRLQAEINEVTPRIMLMSKIFFAFALSSKIEKEDFYKKLQALMKDNSRFRVAETRGSAISFDDIVVETNISKS